MLIHQYNAVKTAYKTEELKSVISDTVLKNFNRTRLYKADHDVLAKEIEKLDIGVSISKLSDADATITIGKKKYNVKNPMDRIKFISEFGEVLKDIKSMYPNNMFINFIKVTGNNNGSLYGIESAMFLPSQAKADLMTALDSIAKEAYKTDTDVSYDAASTNNATNALKALEFMSLLTYGRSGRDNMLSLLPRVARAKFDDKATEISTEMTTLINNIKRDGISNPDLVYMLLKTSQLEQLPRDYKPDTNSLLFNDGPVNPSEETTNDKRDGTKEEANANQEVDEESYVDWNVSAFTFKSITKDTANALLTKDGKRVLLGSPYPSRYNMYGVNGLIAPITKNVPSLTLLPKHLKEVYNGAKTITISANEAYNMRQADNMNTINNALAMDRGYNVNILGQAYKLTGKATKTSAENKGIMPKYTLTLIEPAVQEYKALSSYEGMEFSYHAIDTRRFDSFLDRIGNVFPNVKIKTVRLGSAAEIASVSNGMVILNMDRFSPSSAIHELAHIYTMIIKSTNPEMYQDLYDEAMWHVDNDSEMYKYVVNKYGGIINNIGSKANVSEELIFEIISNIIQKSYGNAMDAFYTSNDVSADTVNRINDSTSKEGVFQRFFTKVGNLLSKLFGLNKSKINKAFDLSANKPMTIQSMGQQLYDAIISGKAISYMTSSELASLGHSTLFAANTNSKVNNSNDLISKFMKENHKFSNMTDDEKVAEIYNYSLQYGRIVWGDYSYPTSSLGKDQIEALIRKEILPKFQTNMAGFKTDLVKALTSMKADFNHTYLSKGMGTHTTTGMPIYHDTAIDSLAKIVGYDKTKKYAKLSDLVNGDNKITLDSHKQAFKALKDLIGYDPVICIEHESNNQLVVSIYDFINNSFNATGGIGIPISNLLADYGLNDKMAKANDFNLTNTNYSVRSVMLTLIANKLQSANSNIKVRDISITKIQTGEEEVKSKGVNSFDISRGLNFMSKNEAFMDTVENSDMIDLFSTEQDNIRVNNIDYFEMLYSTYVDYDYMDYDSDQYDSLLYKMKDKMEDGGLTIEDKVILLRWRIRKLTAIPYSNMDIHHFNELKTCMEAYKQMRESSYDMTQIDTEHMMDGINKMSAQFDIRSEEVQTVRKSIITATNRTLDETRKIKKQSDVAFEYFQKAKGNVKGAVLSPYYIYQDLYATVKVKDVNGAEKDAYIGRIYWTTDVASDEFASQAQSKINDGTLTAEDIQHANIICDKIEDLYIMMFKHQHKQQTGRDQVFMQSSRKWEDVSDDYWRQELVARGYKRGMVPIVPKDYIDSAKAILGKLKLSVKQQGNEYALVEDEQNPMASDNMIDEISNIFINQLSSGARNLTAQADLANIGSSIHPEYGAKARYKYLGFQDDSTNGELHFNPTSGENTNANMNLDLNFCFDMFNLTMNRKAIYEQEVIPVFNAVNKLVKYSSAFSIDKDSVMVQDVMRNILQMAVEGKNYKTKMFGKDMFGKNSGSLGEYIGVVSSATVSAQMLLNVNVGIQSMLINNYKLLIESVIGGQEEDSFIGGVANNTSASAWVFANLGKAYSMAYDFHIIQNTEQSLTNAGWKGTKSNKTLFNQFTANLFNWGTDTKTRTNVLVAKMKKDGVIEAITFDKDGQWEYDDTKDKRFFNEDGSQSDKQKALYTEMLKNHRIAGITLKNVNGEEHLSQPYDWDECNAIKEFADKRLIGSYDNTTKSLMGVEVLGRMATMYFNWFHAAIDNAIGKSHTIETIFQYRVDDQNNVFRDKMQVEGYFRTIAGIIADAGRSKDITRLWHPKNALEKQNIRRFAYTMALAAMMKILYSLIAIDDNDEDDTIGFIDKRNRFLKNLDYSANALTLWQDVLERADSPIPLFNMISAIFDDGFRPKAATRLLPLYPTGRAFVNIFTDYNFK